MSDADTEEKPLDPAVERVRRKLVRFVAINLGILLLALMAVVGALVYRSGGDEVRQASPREGELLTGEIVLPAGVRVLSHALSGDRLTLHAEFSDGRRALFIYDVAGRRMIGRFDLVSE
jgi:hypothetical protein